MSSTSSEIDIAELGVNNAPPMPLKHLAETLLIVLLAVVVIVTGVLIASLPPLPAGWLPWSVVFVLTLTYPLALYGVFRRNRADYWFRVLHFAPMAMALLWLGLQFLMEWVPMLRLAAYWFAWANAAFAVLLILALTALFCLHVIRRRVPRLSALGVLALVFIAVTFFGEKNEWSPTLASVLWQSVPANEVIAAAGSGQIALNPDDKNLNPSSDPQEEEWRQKLRDVAAKSRAAILGKSSSSSIRSVTNSSKSSSRPVAINPPNRLPQSGPGIEVLSGFLIAGYFATLHRRAKRRLLS